MFNRLQQSQDKYWCLHKRMHLLSSASCADFLYDSFPGAAVRGEIEGRARREGSNNFLRFDHL